MEWETHREFAGRLQEAKEAYSDFGDYGHHSYHRSPLLVPVPQRIQLPLAALEEAILFDDIADLMAHVETLSTRTPVPAAIRRWFGRTNLVATCVNLLFRSAPGEQEAALDTLLGEYNILPPPPRGLYIEGLLSDVYIEKIEKAEWRGVELYAFEIVDQMDRRIESVAVAGDTTNHWRITLPDEEPLRAHDPFRSYDVSFYWANQRIRNVAREALGRYPWLVTTQIMCDSDDDGDDRESTPHEPTLSKAGTD